MKKSIHILTSILSITLILGCEEFLEEKPSKKIVVPNKTEDLHAILNNMSFMNIGIPLGIVLADDMFTDDQGWLGFSLDWEREAYLWKKDLENQLGSVDSWAAQYQTVFYANIVLEEHQKIIARNSAEQTELNTVRGGALFFRANAFSELLQFFCEPYLSPADGTKEGIPLKLSADINNFEGLASQEAVYQRIISDLTEASELLPVTVNTLNIPSKTSAFALLARIFLIRGDYQKALENADKALALKSDLMDYSSLPLASSIPISQYEYPIPPFNEEVIWHSQMPSQSFIGSPNSYIDTLLYQSYNDNDLRKYLFFFGSGPVNFVGNYTGGFLAFSGLATDELYLIKSECLAHLGNTQESLQVLNTLVSARFKENTFEPYVSQNQNEVLGMVLLERRKQLVFRGYLRWMDMRRFLADPLWEAPAPRSIMGNTYSLGMDPSAYKINIPKNERDLNEKL
jgi:tetratricopeptide (TPR) repeat protein